MRIDTCVQSAAMFVHKGNKPSRHGTSFSGTRTCFQSFLEGFYSKGIGCEVRGLAIGELKVITVQGVQERVYGQGVEALGHELGP